MRDHADINAPIVEALYEEGLELADRVRAAFDLSGRIDAAAEDEDFARIALSCEALRCTTRMMHALAWLLNQRAYFNGEMSEFQLRRHGRLAKRQPDGNRQQLAALPVRIVTLVAETQRFYQRIERLDAAWRERFAMQPPAIERLRQRLEASLAAL